MQRVVVLGRGGAGKSVVARRLGELVGLPVVELDQLFWSIDLRPTPRGRWEEMQKEMAAKADWVLDGDLGPHDSVEPRLARADTVVILDFCALRCAWRAMRRSRERPDFWWWLLTWRRHSRHSLLASVHKWAPNATVHVLRSPRDVRHFLAAATTPSD